MKTKSSSFAGARMMDVRRQVAIAGDGLLAVDKINAGHYVIVTLDDRLWNVVESAGVWRAEAAA